MVHTKFAKNIVIVLAAPAIEIVNQIFFLSQKITQRIACVRKKIFGNLSSTLYFEETEKIKASI